MPLFFVISGGAAFFSLRNRTAWPFVKSRITRLLVPLVLVGTFVINPLYVYAQRLFQGQAGNFLRLVPAHYFDGMYGFGGNFAPLGHGTHLWYLEYLFVFTLILLPWFMRSKKRAAENAARPSRLEKPLARCCSCSCPYRLRPAFSRSWAWAVSGSPEDGTRSRICCFSPMAG